MANGGDGGVRTRERESEGEEGKNRGRVRESRGGRGVVRGIETRRGGAGRQASRWRGAVARACAGHTPLPLSRTKTTEEGGGLGRLLAGPASWLGCTGRSPGKLLLLFIFSFSNF